MNTNKVTKYVADWFRLAEEDLKVAEILLREKGSLNTICFHAQQSAEKYLKGFLAYNEKHVRKVHDLEILVAMCKELDPAFDDIIEDAKYLTQFYVETRYPGDYPEFTLSDAQQALEAAQRIKVFVLQVIEKKK